MRTVGCTIGISVVLVVATLVTGCSHAEDCELNPILECGSWTPKGTGGGTSSSTSTSSTGTGGAPASCIPSESQEPVADSCGVFVSSSLGVDGNEADRGTKEKPFKSITAALNKANATRVYACAESFSEPVTISAAVELYGALDCTKSWAYVGATIKTALKADSDKVPLTLTGDATIEDFAITAVDATTDGGSSIAVIADQVTASFARCNLVAGAGKAGLAGTTPNDAVGPADSSDAAIKGNDGAIACTAAATQFGGAAKENALCPAANGGPLGGRGGVGSVNNGSNGDLQPTASVQTALGGVGQPNLDPLWSCVAGSGLGSGGTNGVGGTPGEGATGATALGTIGMAGYSGVAGQVGGLALPGQGGGGGGGAKGKLSCAGASGGGGGAGGCGGKGGLGGNAGGASIALVSLGATLSFEKVTIQPGIGGDGGNGGDGQGGGVGGDGGTGGKGDSTAPATLKACNGGAGGQGGTGGKGGGGRGGHAIGIAYTGTAMPSSNGITFAKGTPGKGGSGAADMMYDGDAGVQADMQVFP